MAEQRSQDDAPSDTPPATLATLTERFDPAVMDVPSGSARVRLKVSGEREWDAVISPHGIELAPADGSNYDAELSADAATWQGIAEDVRGGMSAFRKGSLRVRRNLHLGVGFLAATSGLVDPARLRFTSVETRAGKLSTLAAGRGSPIVCIHGLGATKASFLPSVAALADDWRVIAVDLPGFGESDKPLGAAYDAPYFAGAVTALLDELGMERAHLVGNSMGGRVAIEVGLLYPERVGRIALLSPALAWLRDRRWRWLLRAPLPMLGLIQPAPRVITEAIVRSLVPGGRGGWSAAGVDEFLRSYLTPRGRVAFYEAARNIYLDEPHGEEGLWTRLAGMSPEALFVWGRHDQLVPIGFRKHVERVLPAARHLELDCAHVPQLEAPDDTHRAIREFFAGR
jgi:pimeloyl-ACP methyl ester carboxylesterase